MGATSALKSQPALAPLRSSAASASRRSRSVARRCRISSAMTTHAALTCAAPGGVARSMPRWTHLHLLQRATALRGGPVGMAKAVALSASSDPSSLAAAARAPLRASSSFRPSAPRHGVGRTMAAKGGAGSKADVNSATPNGPNKTAADAVNNGLACFERRRYKDAVDNFTQAITAFGTPTEDECRAALYNRACAHVKLGQYDEAKADVARACNDYSLKFSVVLKDPDMEVFRSTPQYEEMAAEEVKGFRSNKAISNLRAEAQEPFRFLKLYVFGGGLAGATVGLVIILSRLAAALKGGPDAPELDEAIKNVAVNVTAIAVFGYLLKGELAARENIREKVAREEEMGRLRVAIAEKEEDVLVSQLRGNYRIFIIAGSEAHIEDTIASLAKYKALLKENNVIICTVDMLTGKGSGKKVKVPGAGVAALAAEFAAQREADAEGDAAPEEAPGIEFGKRSRRVEVATKASRVTEKRWRVAPVDEEKWRAWVINEVERNGFDPNVRDVFFSIGKDGTLWKSGAGIPNWMKLIEELPTGVTGGLSGV